MQKVRFFITIILSLCFISNHTVFSNNPKKQREIDIVKQQFFKRFGNRAKVPYAVCINYLKKIGTPAAIRFLNSYMYYEKGLRLMKRRNYSQAIRAFNIAINLDSKNPNSWDSSGTSFLLLGKYNQAINNYTKAINLFPKTGFYYIERALAYYKVGNINAAIKDFKIAARLDEPIAKKVMIVLHNNFKSASNSNLNWREKLRKDICASITERYFHGSSKAKKAFRRQIEAAWNNSK